MDVVPSGDGAFPLVAWTLCVCVGGGGSEQVWNAGDVWVLSLVCVMRARMTCVPRLSPFGKVGQAWFIDKEA